MKDFFKTFLAVICAIFVLNILATITFVMTMGAMAGMADTKPVLPQSGVLALDLSQMTIGEQASEPNPMDLLQQKGRIKASVGLWEAVGAIRTAAADPAVKYIYLKTENSATGISILEEIRQALGNFRKSGKAVIAYVENPTAGSYYLASIADKIYMNGNAGASPMITGISSQMIFLKDLLDRFGVNIQLIRHGKFKSAGEMFIRNTPSQENMEQNQALVRSLWETLSSEIAAARGLDARTFSALVNELQLGSAEALRSHGLVDKIVTREELKGELATLAGVAKPSDLKYIPFQNYVKAKAAEQKAKKKIAVIYAEGEIVTGDQKQEIAGDRFASLIAKVRADSTVKAVVLRVASGGGSVLAADKIKTELDLLRKDKPLIASYGNAAASGGYWISANADKIFSDRTTLTGSIGVFSMIPDVSKTTKEVLKVNVVNVGSNRHSDMWQLMRPLDGTETEYLQRQVEDIYDKFVSTVAEGRELKPDYVDSIAQGRVWSGSDALGLRLVDEIGTLEDAVNYAIISAGAETVDLKDWTIEACPKKPSAMEMLMEAIGMGGDPMGKAVAGTPFRGLYTAFKDWNFRTSEHLYARLPWEFCLNF